MTKAPLKHRHPTPPPDSPNTVELAKAVGRDKPALAGVSGNPKAQMPEKPLAPPLRLRSGQAYSGLCPNASSTALAAIAHAVWHINMLLALVGMVTFLPLQAAVLDLELPKTGIAVEELAVVVNDSDPMSEKIAEYYRLRRGIPSQNILHVRFAANTSNLPRNAFKQVRESVLEQTGPHIQAYALAWTRPYRVDCMSITSAFAFGFDEAYCSKTCGMTKPSALFNSASHAPYADLGIRPAMMLAGKSLEEVKRLIDRGAASDHTYPDRTGYLLNTTDANRTVRAVYFDETVNMLGEAFHLERLDANSIQGKTDVLFYFTGSAWVEDLASLRFVPGSIADHLTSSGGVLDGSGQMSSLRWLEAGATGSFGTVVEPCNHLQKFPVPTVALWHYAEGDTLLEAYWKSVAWPGEGVFIGEPLAHPFAPSWVDVTEDQATLKIFSPRRKQVRLEGSENPVGPYHAIDSYPVSPGMNEIKIHFPESKRYYRVKF
jgi:uncharacterized protein (TIGR03790 family)